MVGEEDLVTAAWSPEQLELLGAAEELEVATWRADGTLRRPVPIWVVRVGAEVYVRTWHRRENGWFGHAVATRRARIRVPGLEADVVVEDVGEGTADQRSGVDAAYREKYGRYGDATVARMVAEDAVAATLRLLPGRSGLG